MRTHHHNQFVRQSVEFDVLLNSTQYRSFQRHQKHIQNNTISTDMCEQLLSKHTKCYY